MDQLFDPNEELPTRDSWDNHEINGPLDTRGSWINSHLGQFACPAIRFEGCDASVIDAVHPLIKKLVNVSEKLVEQEQVLRHIRQDKRFLEADKIAQLQRTAKVDAEETARLKYELADAQSQLAKVKKQMSQRATPSKTNERQLQNQLRRAEAQIEAQLLQLQARPQVSHMHGSVV